MIATAAAALALDPRPAPPGPGADTSSRAAHVRRLHARMARDVAIMLGAPAAHVVADDDPARRYGGHPGHVLTVHDPDDVPLRARARARRALPPARRVPRLRRAGGPDGDRVRAGRSRPLEIGRPHR
jgi:hypothetical protein